MKKNKKYGQEGFTLIEILIVIGIIAALATIVIVAINPARQFAQARNTQRLSHVNSILNAVGQYFSENKGVLPPGIPKKPDASKSISKLGANLCDLLVDEYMPVLLSDPSITQGAMSDGQINQTECLGDYDTGYKIVEEESGRITVSAPSAELDQTISVTR